MTLQLYYISGHFISFTSIIFKLTLARGVCSFVAFLLIDIKPFPQSFSIQLINLSSSNQIFRVLNFRYLILIVMTLNLTDYLIGLSRRDLAIAEVIVVYSDIEMTPVWTTWRH
jgi:hypothetical protein